MEDVVRRTALEIFSDVIKGTPVDTGRAKGAWTPSLRTMPTKFDDGESKSPLGTISRDKRNELISLLSKFSGDGSIYLANNLDYIVFLERGSSRQAPAGMVATSVARFSQYIKEAISERI